jgi:nucleoside-diphosphate-sugar epimerase
VNSYLPWLHRKSLNLHISIHTNLRCRYILVTGATGFIGAHVVDELLGRGLKVRGATRSLTKGEVMLKARPNFTSKLDFVQIEDFEKVGVFKDAVKDIDAVIHVASVCYSFPRDP